ncbi:MAG TPA: prenyltransferase/squalene oxidase repeat-containing protein, partial [Caulifigura sp.]|nr:prenyltransferase/squalene oxidase repeat-containing protein [Caulifigura sp.]
MLRSFLVTAAVVIVAQPLFAQDKLDLKKIEEAQTKAINFLKTTQAEDGSWTSPTQPGVSGLVVYSLLTSGVPVDDPTVAKGLKHLESFIQKDGGIYDPNTSHKNYETSIIVTALTEANKDGRYAETIAKAVDFLKGIQWDGPEGAAEVDPAFGGQGYGRSKRPDLSNTAFFLEALTAAGVSKNDPAFKNALVFVSRCQNLKGSNDTVFGDKINDGGFYYTPAGGGASMAGPATPEGGLRSYGSMTYAGLKSMVYAGLTKDDPRVKAASEWIAKFYTLEENPGMGQQGLYYYLLTAARTFKALGTDEFVDAKGGKHPWRAE